jgi:hypothetical protein
MVPRRAVLHGFEFVSVALPWSNGALGNTIYAVMLGIVELPDSVPVYRRSIALQVIRDGDLDIVTPAGFDPRTGVPLIEHH